MKAFWKEHGGTFVMFLLCAMIYFILFLLYQLPLEAVLYPTVLCSFLLLGYGIVRFYHSKKKHRELGHLKSLPDDLLERLREYENQDDRDYQDLLELVQNMRKREQENYRKHLTDSMDYYTTWVHQIKTPIASMRLKLEQEDSPFSRGLMEELFRIEQYVDMVLTYLRLNSSSTDYVIKEHSLETIVKGAVRKFAGQFIGRGIRLELKVSDQKVITDDKWISFVIEQILSNSLKYTRKGSVSIYVEEPLTLCIKDTGIGIAPEDLPRIFERGYTGYNGRQNSRASGLGLFLCKQICDNLGVKISAHSKLGEGTILCLNLEQKKYQHE